MCADRPCGWTRCEWICVQIGLVDGLDVKGCVQIRLVDGLDVKGYVCRYDYFHLAHNCLH